MTDGRLVLFVCTGNICRSAMAEAIARDRYGDESLSFASAGVWAVADAAATPTAVDACREIGIEMLGHRATQFDGSEGADLILVMTDAHCQEVGLIAPAVADRVELLRLDGVDVEDPYGLDLPAYRTTRDEIAAALEERFGQPA